MAMVFAFRMAAVRFLLTSCGIFFKDQALSFLKRIQISRYMSQ
jgi:hypothetical protein